MAGIPFILQFPGQEPSICPKSFIAVFEFLILHSRHTHSSEEKTDGSFDVRRMRTREEGGLKCGRPAGATSKRASENNLEWEIKI